MRTICTLPPDNFGMSNNKPATSKDWVNGLGVIAGIICAFAGYDQGGWIGAIIAAFVAFGGVHLMFIAIWKHCVFVCLIRYWCFFHGCGIRR